MILCATTAAQEVVPGPTAPGPSGPGRQRAGPSAHKTHLPKQDTVGDQAAQDRSGPPVSADRQTLTHQERLRELRPRGGRSPWRALYERHGSAFVIAAVAPEAEVNSRGFDRAVRLARRRLEGSR